MNVQYIVVFGIVIAAAAYLVYSLYKSSKGHACGSGKCGCEGKLK